MFTVTFKNIVVKPITANPDPKNPRDYHFISEDETAEYIKKMGFKKLRRKERPIQVLADLDNGTFENLWDIPKLNDPENEKGMKYKEYETLYLITIIFIVWIAYDDSGEKRKYHTILPNIVCPHWRASLVIIISRATGRIGDNIMDEDAEIQYECSYMARKRARDVLAKIQRLYFKQHGGPGKMSDVELVEKYRLNAFAEVFHIEYNNGRGQIKFDPSKVPKWSDFHELFARIPGLLSGLSRFF